MAFEVGEGGFRDKVDQPEMERGRDLFADFLGIFEPLDGVEAFEVIQPILRESHGDRADQVADEFGIGSATYDLDDLEGGGFSSHQFDDLGHDRRVIGLEEEFLSCRADRIGSRTQEILDESMFQRSENEETFEVDLDIFQFSRIDRAFECFEKLIPDEKRITDRACGVIFGAEKLIEAVSQVADQIDDLSLIGRIGTFEVLDESQEVLEVIGGGDDCQRIGPELVVPLQDRLADRVGNDGCVASQDFLDAGRIEVDASNEFEMGGILAAKDQGFGGGGTNGGGIDSQSRDQRRDRVRALGVREILECQEERFVHGRGSRPSAKVKLARIRERIRLLADRLVEGGM